MKQMAIIKGVSFGVGDRGTAVLWFSVHLSESLAALIVIPASPAVEIIQKHKVRDVKDLEGKPCWVEVHGNNVEFVDLIKI